MKIDELILQSAKLKNRVELNAYKNLKAELQKMLTAKNAPEYSDSLFVQVAAKYAKTLEDAIAQFENGGRKDLSKEYKAELDVIKKLIPEEATPSDIMLALTEYAGKYDLLVWVDENNPNLFKKPAIPKRELNSTMKYLKERFPTTDGKKLMGVLKEYIVG